MKTTIVLFAFLIAVVIGYSLAELDSKDNNSLAKRHQKFWKQQCARGLNRATTDILSVYLKTPPATSDLKGDIMYYVVQKSTERFNKLRTENAEAECIAPSKDFRTLISNNIIPCNKEIAQNAFKTANDAIKLLWAINNTSLD